MKSNIRVRCDSTSDNETDFPNVSSSNKLPDLVPDIKAQYYQFSQKSSWFAKFSRNASYSLKRFFHGSLKEFFIISGQPIFLLGKEYPCYPPLKKFYRSLKKRLFSVIWVTYRCDFRPLIVRTPGSGEFTTDAGWGCTIRVGQMLFLNTLSHHFQLTQAENYEIIKTIEENSLIAPYSLHNLLAVSQSHQPGEWFSPSDISHSLSDILDQFPIPGFRIKVFMDSVIYKDELYSIATDNNIDAVCVCEGESDDAAEVCANCGKILCRGWNNSVLVLMPLMLGVRKIQKELIDAFKFLLETPTCVGIIGGRPKSALYLIGYKEDSVIYLDPHYTQPAHRTLTDLKRRISTYYTESLSTTSISSLESSMSVGFYFNSPQSFHDFSESLKEPSRCGGLIYTRASAPECPIKNFIETEDGFIII